jgi:O-antigen ligase
MPADGLSRTAEDLSIGRGRVRQCTKFATLMPLLIACDNLTSKGRSASRNMTMAAALRAKALDRRALHRFADWSAVAVAVSLPWSTSATVILVVVWFLAVFATLDAAAVKRELATGAGGLPVLLWVLAAIGLLWADVSWRERFDGLVPFSRLLLIPVLLAQFRRSERGLWVLFAFFLSATGVLLVSWLLVLFPGLPWHTHGFGVPAKDYILQSGEFLMCAFALFAIASDNVGAGRWPLIAGSLALAVLFLANIAFVDTARTTLLVGPVLALLLGWRQFRWRGLFGGAALFCILGVLAVIASPYLRERLHRSFSELRAYEAHDTVNSTSLHLQFLHESLSFVESAPIIGHGTGSIPEQFRKAVIGHTGAAGFVSDNPHNQILTVTIQLGLVGAAVLIAMWAAHLLLFRGFSLISWIGMIVVTENIVSSLVNSHLFDFTQAWLYIFGVGVAGGTVLRRRNAAPRESAGWSRVPHEADRTSA